MNKLNLMIKKIIYILSYYVINLTCCYLIVMVLYFTYYLNKLT